jgi:hypothetical protein
MGVIQAVFEATQEAIYNSPCLAEMRIGYHGVKVVALPFSFVENKASISDKSKQD